MSTKDPRDEAVPPGAATGTADEDAARLAELGYKQELHRGMSAFSNFAVSFSIISVLAGCITTYYLAMDAGGPVVISIGWPLVGLFVLDGLPVDGGGLLGLPDRGRPVLLGGPARQAQQAGVGLVRRVVQLPRRGRGDGGHRLRRGDHLDGAAQPDLRRRRHASRSTFVAFLVIIALHGLLNTFGVNLVKVLSNVSAWWHIVGVLVIVVILWAVPDQHQSLSWTFTEFVNETGFSSPIYVFLVGLLMAQYTYTGYDASRPRRRGDPQRRGRRAQGHRPERLGLDHRRLDPARLGDRGDPGLRGLRATATPGCRPPRSSSTRSARTSASSCSSSPRSPSSSAAWRRSRRTRGWRSPSPATTRCPARRCGRR